MRSCVCGSNVYVYVADKSVLFVFLSFLFLQAATLRCHCFFSFHFLFFLLLAKGKVAAGAVNISGSPSLGQYQPSTFAELSPVINHCCYTAAGWARWAFQFSSYTPEMVFCSKSTTRLQPTPIPHETHTRPLFAFILFPSRLLFHSCFYSVYISFFLLFFRSLSLMS